jgi:hypothetical protein
MRSSPNLKIVAGRGAALWRAAGRRDMPDPPHGRPDRLLPHRDGLRADREQFRILFLDKKNQLIADEVQQVGTVDHTPVYPREVVKRALELSASALILVHNHPKMPISITQDHAQYETLKFSSIF